MKITSIQIARFGIWQQLTLPVRGRGLALFYGPNEAGKTTLWRFIRSILYGFEPFAIELRDGTSRPVCWEGTLRVQSQDAPEAGAGAGAGRGPGGGSEYEIRRVADRGTTGLVSVVGTHREQPAEALLAELLHHTDAALFENVFAVGLNELQELATLQGDDVAQHIYGLTLGPTGRRLLEAATAIDRERSALIDAASRAGRVVDLLEREEALRDELEAGRSQREEHAELCAQRHRIEQQIEALRREETDVSRQLAGHELLARVFPHWSQVRDYRRELDSIPEVSGFPADGLAELKKLDAQIEAAAAARRTLVESVKALRAKLSCFAGHRQRSAQAAALVGFVEQAGWYRDVTQQRAAARERADAIKAELDRSLEGLGPGWAAARVEGADTGIGARRRIMAAASRYRAALVRRKRMLRLRKRLNRAVGRQSARLAEWLKDLDGQSIDEAIAAQTRRLTDLREIGGLRLREAELVSRREVTISQTESAHERPELPPWIPKFLAGLLAAGLLVTTIGLFQAAAMDVVAGMSLACIGLCGLGVGWGFRRHLEIHSQIPAGSTDEGLPQIETQLAETRAAIARLTGGSDRPTDPTPDVTVRESSNPAVPSRLRVVSPPPPPAPHDACEEPQKQAERLLEATARLAELQGWNRARRAIQARRRRLSDLRSRFQGAQRDLSIERQNWCSLLKDVGLAETVKIDEALVAWHRLTDARDQLRLWKSALDEVQHLEQSTASFRARMDEAGRRAGRSPAEGKETLDVLAEWDAELKSLAIVREEYRRTRRELTEHRRKADHAQRKLRRLQWRASALFVKGGASNRGEFVERAGWLERRQECEALLAIANDELNEAAATEPELAIVEDDLERFHGDENQRRIDTLSSELERIEKDRQAAFEELGSVKQAIKTLEADDGPSRLRFEVSQTTYELARAAEEWFGVELARHALDRVRSKFERSCQPATLALASKYLEQLTRGRYGNIWTPLGQRDLRIDDDRGRTFAVQELSGGTREQLFLAIRMATVRELAQKGIELPMVLDDVLVNFDQLRTEAAVEALLEFAEENQQVLFFTCHLHLAHMFEARGVEPTWLPGHNLPQQERRAG